MLYSGVLLHLDGIEDKQGHIFKETVRVEAPENVPVTNNFDDTKILGYAKVFKHKDKLMYVMDIDLPKEYDHSVPALNAMKINGDPKLVTHFSVNGIGLCNSNIDPRINQLYKQKTRRIK